MRQQSPSYSLLPLAAKAMKYFLLGLTGRTVAYIVSVVLQFSLLSGLMIKVLEDVFSRGFVLILCLGAIAVITESLRN